MTSTSSCVKEIQSTKAHMFDVCMMYDNPTGNINIHEWMWNIHDLASINRVLIFSVATFSPYHVL